MKVKCLLLGVVVLFVAGVLTASSFAKIGLETCIGMWLFDEGGGDVAEDSSVSENDGTLVNGPKWVDGKFGEALEFNGSNTYVDCGNQENLNLGTSDMSMVAWIKSVKGTPTGWFAMIACKIDNAVYIGYRISVRGDADTTNQNKLHFLIGNGVAGTAGFNLFGNSAVTDDSWHHIAVTAERKGVAKLYKDGKVESQADISSFATYNNDNTKNFYIGCLSPGSGVFRGVIDEVAVFRTALSESDVTNIMTNGLVKAINPTAVKPAGKLTTTWASIKAR